MAAIKQHIGSAKSVKQTIIGGTLEVALELKNEGYSSSVTENPTVVDQSINNGGVTSDEVARVLWGAITGNILNQTDLMGIMNNQKEDIESKIPTKVSDLENDSDYINVSFLEAALNGIEGCKVITLNNLQYNLLALKNPTNVYLVYRLDGTLSRVYVGSVLLAKKGEKGIQGFPYNFPIVF